MEIVLARIDNRLLHGIVVSQWAGTTGADRVMVINDRVANDSFLKSSMMLAKPTGMSISIITEEVAYVNFAANKYLNQKIFLLITNPRIILNLLNINIKIKHLCIGGTELINSGIKLSNRAYITEEEAQVYRLIKEKGVHIDVQHCHQWKL